MQSTVTPASVTLTAREAMNRWKYEPIVMDLKPLPPGWRGYWFEHTEAPAVYRLPLLLAVCVDDRRDPVTGAPDPDQPPMSERERYGMYYSMDPSVPGLVHAYGDDDFWKALTPDDPEPAHAEVVYYWTAWKKRLDAQRAAAATS